MRLKNQKKGKLIDKTGAYQRFIQEQFYKLLMKTGVAYQDYLHSDVDLLKHPPYIKGLDPSSGQGITDTFTDIELTPEEAKQIDKGLSHRDILLMRSYKLLPNMVGK
jgi:hypothetical protein